MSEGEIQSSILHALKGAGVFVWRNRQVGRRGHRGASAGGHADIVGVVPVYHTNGIGRFFALEIKTEKGQPSFEQIEWANAVIRDGGYVAIARDVYEAISHLQRCKRGLFPPEFA